MIVRVLRAIPLRVRRVGFAVYAVALATGTHWPSLTLGPDTGIRLDLVVHFAAFAVWTVLLSGCEWFGTLLSRRNVGWCVTISAAYAALDEVTQGLPGVNRTVLWSDLMANWSGVALASVWLLAAGRLGDRKPNVPVQAGG
ncbi:MAG: VanZ family protein [Phycisphaeraceae bacterium]|nr:VanZ family protein [Phycisphaeraceae bacterium]